MRLTCPICGRKLEVPEEFEFRPFCSGRCKKVDLHNWFSEKYSISEALDYTETEAEPDQEEPGGTAAGRGRADS